MGNFQGTEGLIDPFEAWRAFIGLAIALALSGLWFLATFLLLKHFEARARARSKFRGKGKTCQE